jgi:hypothetical protein
MARVYGLYSEQLCLYVGSTTQSLKAREREHRCKSNTSGSKDIPDDCQWSMLLLETCAIDVMRGREQFYFDKLKPLYNLINPKTDKKEYDKQYQRAYDATHKEQKKVYQAANKEQIKTRRRAKRLIARTAVVHQSVTVPVSS